MNHESPVWEFDGADGLSLRMAIIPGKKQFGLVIVRGEEKVSPVLTFSGTKVLELVYYVLSCGMQNARRLDVGWDAIPYSTPESLRLMGVDKQVRRLK